MLLQKPVCRSRVRTNDESLIGASEVSRSQPVTQIRESYAAVLQHLISTRKRILQRDGTAIILVVAQTRASIAGRRRQQTRENGRVRARESRAREPRAGYNAGALQYRLIELGCRVLKKHLAAESGKRIRCSRRVNLREQNIVGGSEIKRKRERRRGARRRLKSHGSDALRIRVPHAEVAGERKERRIHASVVKIRGARAEVLRVIGSECTGEYGWLSQKILACEFKRVIAGEVCRCKRPDSGFHNS